jgi:hypothetical protein
MPITRWILRPFYGKYTVGLHHPITRVAGITRVGGFPGEFMGGNAPVRVVARSRPGAGLGKG